MNLKKTMTAMIAGTTVLTGLTVPAEAYALPVAGWTQENLSVLKEQNDALDEEEEKQAEAEKKAKKETEEYNRRVSDVGILSEPGKNLTKRGGVFYGPSGKESYYNLPINGVLRNMAAAGYELTYFVRSDGVKMVRDKDGNNYVMAAADLSVRPKGTVVQTSLGKALVVDTGSFVNNGDPYALDIAVAWRVFKRN